MSNKTKNRLSQVSHHGCISMFTTCEYTRPIFKKKCSKQYKTKTYTINFNTQKNAHNMRVAKQLFLRVRNSEEK